MRLDARTIMLITIISGLLMSGGLFAVSRGYLGAVRGVAQWAKATLIQACGWIVVGALRGVIPDLLSIVLGNLLIMLALGLYLMILAEFTNTQIRTGWIYAVVASEAILLAYFASVEPNLSARVVVISICGSILMFSSAHLLLRKPGPRLASHLFMAGLYLVCSLFMLLRALFHLLWQPGPEQLPFAQNAINDVSYLVFYLFAVMLTFGFTLMCNDRYISQQRQADEALKQSHDLLTKLAAQVPGVIYQYQLFPDGRSCFPFATAGISEIYEVTPEQVKDDARLVLAYLHPEDTEQIINSINESARSMKPWRLDYRVILPRQGVRWRAGHAQPQKQADGSILWHGFITDITDTALAQQKQAALEQEVHASEKRLRRLINSSLIGIIEGDQQGRLLEANDVLLQLAGYPHRALAAGELNWFALTSPAAQTRQQQALQELAEHGVSAPFESQLLAQDGSVVPIMLGLAQLEGSSQEWVGFVLDLREQKRVDHLQAEFISIVSHELRTPLTSIRGSLGLLEAGVAGSLPPQAQQLISIAHKNSQRLVSLVSDILDMEKLATGNMRIEMQTLELITLAQQAIDANAAYGAGFQVRFALQTELPQVQVKADAARLMQVFANLLSNAAKFAPAGDCVLLRVRREAQHTRGVRVEVEDHGRGIPASFHAQIFSKFAQADAAATRHLDGAGLGLHITKTLIEKMGGKIGFDSQEGVKTVFWFTLPEISPD